MKNASTELGPLQQAVMEYVWDHPGCTVRDCRDALAELQHKDHAYTTIQTVFDSLHRKRMLGRRRDKNAFRYTARQSRADLLLAAFRNTLAKIRLGPQPVASSLVDALEQEQGAELDALVAELRSRGYIK